MKEISVVVANIDRFGPTTNVFLESPAANGIAGFMFSEMHVKEQGLFKLRSKFALQGFHSSVSAASQSELSQAGSCGGTATLFRSYLAISHPFGSIQPGAVGFDWSSITLLLKGTPVMFVSVYLTCNTGITGVNLQKLSEIGVHIKNAGIPFVIAGDWNVPPSELLESGWPARIKGEILPPSDLEISCTSGRLIDYAVCHRSIANIARLSSFVEGPWKTHQALLLTLPRSPRRFLTRSLVDSPMKFPSVDRNAGSVSWSDFIHQSRSLHFQPPSRTLPTFLDPDPSLSQKLALKYKRWSSASVKFLLSKCEAEKLNQKNFLGRGSEINFRLKPVVQRIPPVEEHFTDQECRFWSRLLSRLKFLAVLVEHNRGIQQRTGIIKYIRNTSCPQLRSMIMKSDMEARKRGLSEILHRIEQVTCGVLNPSAVIGDVASFHKEARFAVLSKLNDEFKQWCLNSLTKGAAGAHAFLRKADEPPQIHITFNDKRGNGSDPCTALSFRSDVWRKHWTKHDSDRRADQLAAIFKQTRDEAVVFQEASGYSSFTAKQVTDALRSMKTERACGLDHWSPSNWLNLPIEARKEIASILSECETGLVWPHQVMQNAVALLGKSATDDRPISLTSLLYAVYVKIKKHVIADFDRAHATLCHSAVAGNSCLREGIRRRFVSEVACLNGKHCVDTFLDLEKFYDSIDNVKLIQQACQLKWNPVVLYMSLLVHMAPRVLRIGDLWGGSHHATPSSKGAVLRILGPGRCCTTCYKTYILVFLFKLASKLTI